MLGLFKKKNVIELNPGETILKLVPNGEPVEYSDVLGFFKFRDTLYYRGKGVSGKTVDNSQVSFSENIKDTYPLEFSNILSKDVGKIMVQPYIIIQ